MLGRHAGKAVLSDPYIPPNCTGPHPSTLGIDYKRGVEDELEKGYRGTEVTYHLLLGAHVLARPETKEVGDAASSDVAPSRS